MKFLIILAILSSILFAGNYKKTGVAPVNNKLYLNECSSCHFAYQAGLLPSSSWKKIMNNLENHFDTDASLDEDDLKTLSKYLNDNSAEKSMNYKRSRRIVNSIRNNKIPTSISTTPYLLNKHRKIQTSLITQKEVKGIFNCMACHTTADKGIYKESDINIPNYGTWDD